MYIFYQDHLFMKTLRLKQIKLQIATICALLATPAYSGQQTGLITQVITRASDGLVYFYMSGSPSDRPSCATNSYWMIKDENSAAGKRQLAVLLTARATSKEVTVTGSNTCSRWGDGEDVEEVRY